MVRGDQIKGFVANVIEGSADILVGVRSMAGGPGWTVVAYDFSATGRGPIPVSGALGKSFTVPAAAVSEVAGETIRRSSDDADPSAIQQQLGLPSPPGEGGAPTATPAAEPPRGPIRRRGTRGVSRPPRAKAVPRTDLHAAPP